MKNRVDTQFCGKKVTHNKSVSYMIFYVNLHELLGLGITIALSYLLFFSTLWTQIYMCYNLYGSIILPLKVFLCEQLQINFVNYFLLFPAQQERLPKRYHFTVYLKRQRLVDTSLATPTHLVRWRILSGSHFFLIRYPITTIGWLFVIRTSLKPTIHLIQLKVAFVFFKYFNCILVRWVHLHKSRSLI